jgi:hypothetical protein
MNWLKNLFLRFRDQASPPVVEDAETGGEIAHHIDIDSELAENVFKEIGIFVKFDYTHEKLQKMKRVRKILHTLFTCGFITMIVLTTKKIIIIDSGSLNWILLFIPIHINYIFATWDLYFKKVRIVDANMRSLDMFYTSFNKTIANEEAKKYILDVSERLGEEYKAYEKELHLWLIIPRILTWSPPKYHQLLEEIDMVEEKLKYAISFDESNPTP